MVKTRINRFIATPFVVSLTSSQVLDYIVRSAYYKRDLETVKKVAPLLNESLAKHYIALSENNWKDSSVFDINIADPYKHRVILSLAQLSRKSGDLNTCFRLCLESYRFAEAYGDIAAMYQAQKEIAINLSLKGDHKGALKELEGASKLCRAASKTFPFIHYDHFNSLAVELGETGRLEEAQNASRIALASGFASAYPEWRETAEELELKGLRPSRSIVAFSASANKKIVDTVAVLPLRAPQSAESADSTGTCANRLRRPAPVLDFQLWKKRMGKEPTSKPEKEMSTREMLLRMLELISEKSVTDDQLARMLESVENIALESKG